ncbi:hypothetical protein ACVWZM_002126 [Bradyrhizobium sp. USDA 4501]
MAAAKNATRRANEAGPAAGGRRAGLRSAVRGEEDRKVGTVVKKAVKKVGDARKRMEKQLGRRVRDELA